MSEISFLDRVLAQVLEILRKMPALWFTEGNAQNAWEMLVQLWPDDEPGMGIWDEIQSVLIGWIEGVVEKQPIDEVREYWIAETYPGSRFSCSDDYVDDPDAALNGLAMGEISRDVAREILESVLHQAEDENRRREEAAEEEAPGWEWDDLPPRLLEVPVKAVKQAIKAGKLATFLKGRLGDPPTQRPFILIDSQDAVDDAIRTTEAGENLTRWLSKLTDPEQDSLIEALEEIDPSEILAQSASEWMPV